jgi:hypothetical protein
MKNGFYCRNVVVLQLQSDKEAKGVWKKHKSKEGKWLHATSHDDESKNNKFGTFFLFSSKLASHYYIFKLISFKRVFFMSHFIWDK